MLFSRVSQGLFNVVSSCCIFMTTCNNVLVRSASRFLSVIINRQMARHKALVGNFISIQMTVCISLNFSTEYASNCIDFKKISAFILTVRSRYEVLMLYALSMIPARIHRSCTSSVLENVHRRTCHHTVSHCQLQTRIL